MQSQNAVLSSKMPIATATPDAQVLMWFRQDLRLEDNQALTASCEWARTHLATLKAIYIATPAQWALHDVAPIQLDFIERHLNLLATSLAALGIELEVIQLDSFDEVAHFLKDYCQSQRVGAVFAGAEPEINERQRDQACIQAGVPLQLIEEHCLLAPGTVLNQSGEMYRVFTPFSRKWRALAAERAISPLGVPSPVSHIAVDPAPIHLPRVTTVSSELWPAGEGAAQRLLTEFVAQKVHRYKQNRDFPAIDGTSSLSPYLAIGVVSARQCVAALLHRFPEAIVDDTSPGRTWLNELIWREFYRHLLVAFPALSKNHNFNSQAKHIRWRNDPAEFRAWCEGRTGYPLIDAAMRQLKQTGWMHNRLRMVVASFLTKHLLIDWRWGERYFRQHLLDGDLAANNGGWQWAAGCGCDAQPYFRIFNPMSQSEKFDPDGRFIRKFLPELAAWDNQQLHHPSVRSCDDLFDTQALAYPCAIVDHRAARARALTVLAVLKKAKVG